MRASTCQCSSVSPASGLPLLQLLACTYPTSPWPFGTASLGHPSCGTASCRSTSGNSSTPLLTHCPAAPARFFTVSFVPRVEDALPPARPSSSMHSCTCLGSGFHQQAPPAHSTVHRKDLPLVSPQFGPILPNDFVRKLFSMVSPSEHKPC